MGTVETTAQELLNLAVDYLVRLPALLVWVVGLVVCVACWRRHPRAALLVLLAMAGLLLLSLIMPAAYWAIGMLTEREDSPLADYADTLTRAASVVEFLGEGVAWVLVLLAVFGRRPPAHSAPPVSAVRPVEDVPPPALHEHRPPGPLPS
jgi:hypothetical protein